MKIFWSWQSDTPGKTGRHLIREALDAAIEQLKSEMTLLEAERLDDLHVDQDRQGEPGSPDLAPLIQAKIDSSAVVVADVTAVGVLAPELSDDGKKSKKFINSNVGLEAGFALRALSAKYVLFVFNEHFGSYSDLPFDLKHKAGAITFNLAPSAAKPEIDRARRHLTNRLVKALKLCIEARVAAERKAAPPSSSTHSSGPALFFRRGEVLASIGEPEDNQHLSFRSKYVAYLRIFSTDGGDAPGHAKVVEVARQQRVLPMILRDNGLQMRNANGALVVAYGGRDRVTGLTQLNASGEFWGVNGEVIAERNVQNSGMLLTIPMIAFEKLFVATLRNYVAVLTKSLGRKPPLTAIMGIEGVKGAYLGAPGGPFGSGHYIGPLLVDQLQQTTTLASVDDTAIKEALRPFFAAIYDLAAVNRSDVLSDELVAAHDLPRR
jgi:hypothetical protein